MPNTNSKFKKILLALARYDHRTHRGVAKFAAKHKWHLNCEMAVTGHLPRGWKGDGIVAMLSDNTELSSFVVNSGVPFVDLSVMRDDIPAERVSADNFAIGSLAGEYFLSRGFKNFAFFSTTKEKVSQLRERSYFNTIRERHTFYTRWGSNSDNNYDFLVEELLAAPKPLAVFSSRDLEASITLDACLRAELNVPDQVAILGVDNNELIAESQQVPLSSVNHDVESLGYTGAQLLELILEGRPTNEVPRTISPKGITTRRSTDCMAVNDEQVLSALRFMKINISQKKLNVNLISESVTCPRRSLDKRFKFELGHSIHEELIKMRLRAAKHALINTSRSIEHISIDCGFNTAQYFNNCFRKYTQETPMSYRKSRKTL